MFSKLLVLKYFQKYFYEVRLFQALLVVLSLYTAKRT